MISKNPALFYLTFILLFIECYVVSPEFIHASTSYSTAIQQSPSDKQLLLNGRIWRNQYSKAEGDQFFLANTSLRGSVTFNGRIFDNLDLQYDIANDELILRIESYPVIMMNKEMVDSFSLVFSDRTYHIINAGTDSSGILKGYVNLLYDGPSTLYVKYSKKIQPLAVAGRYDLFVQEHRIYLKIGTKIVPITGKRQLLNLLEDKKKVIRHYLRTNALRLLNKDPITFIPALKFYDSIRDSI